MQFAKSSLLGLAAVFAFALPARTAAAPTLDFAFTNFTLPFVTVVVASGVSQAGVIVGSYEDFNGVYHGFVLKGVNVTTIDAPKAQYSFCEKISPNGLAIVGYYTTTRNFAGVGFLLKNKKFTDILGPKGAVAAIPVGVNDAGEIVGSYIDSSFHQHGFTLKNGKYTSLNVPGAVITGATGINNDGTIVLYWQNSRNVVQSSLYNGSTYKSINVPGATDSKAEDINTNGDVIYTWTDSTGGYHGALRQEGKYYKFDDAQGHGSENTFAYGLNNNRQIVGFELSPNSAYLAIY